MGRIQASDFEIRERPIPGHFAVLFRGNLFAVTSDRQVAEFMMDCQLKCELRYEEIRDEAAGAPAAEHTNQHVPPHSNTGDDQP